MWLNTQYIDLDLPQTYKEKKVNRNRTAKWDICVKNGSIQHKLFKC
jgi:hypothetical protein